MTTAASPLTVAVLGAGTVGATLATGWAKAGHTVVLGSRDPDSARIGDTLAETRAAAASSNVSAATHEQAARSADVVVVTVPGDQVGELVGQLGSSLSSKTVVDATNRRGAASLNSLDVLRDAGGIAYRAFNSTGWEQMRQPTFGTEKAAMPYTGPDGGPDSVVERLIVDIGFEPVWLGDSPAAVEVVDSLARLWFTLVFERGYGRRLGWRLLTEQDD